MTTVQKPEHESTPARPAPGHHEALPAHEEHKKGSVLRKIIIILVIAVFVGFCVWKIVDNRKNAATQGAGPGGPGGGRGGFGGPVAVAAAPVQQRTMPIYYTALGTVTAYNTVTIRSRVDGQLLRVYVTEGQQVKQGQPLMLIDPAPYEAALAVAEGNLARDQATATNARQQATRYDQLYASGVVSREQAQAQEAAAGQADGAVKADQAQIQTAKVNLSYTRINSPINGVVGLRQVDPGNIVSAGSTTGLIVITQMHPISVIFTLPEDQLPEVLKRTRSGQKLPVEAYDRSNTTLLSKGTLLTTDNQIDTTTGTAKLKAVFDNNDNTLFPNQFVNTRLVLENRPNAIVIPTAAVQSGTQGSFVYVVKDGNPPASADGEGPGQGGGQGRQGAGGGRRGQGSAQGQGASGQGGQTQGAQQGPPHYVEMRPIKIEATEGTLDIISSGLQPGEMVVTDGAERLRTNARVTMRPANPMTGSAILGDGQGGGGGRRGQGGAKGPGAPGSTAPASDNSGQGRGSSSRPRGQRPQGGEQP
ncbi:MdtA/MuxA family multidrug efflux RND transporter periplasmic adaptor subunit [Terriglobus albidus]|uniref:MdtA/MuxA family multidrug efflux RND transporter periplasmic adaptor subunit n=1 Tax=Terriglobus albidus TaxID=1592106 RepID=UPI0021DFA9A2|nr:MdtA/MuxA family multidrug efflux RND transporter periplasmic adaptor subunit [Terriglobus albidus]